MCKLFRRMSCGQDWTRRATAVAVSRLGQVRIEPYAPRTDGKAERIVEAALRELAYARARQTSRQHAGRLQAWLYQHDRRRAHGGRNDRTPVTRLGPIGNGLMELPT